jgi:DNA-directed RNA polymerase subunit E"
VYSRYDLTDEKCPICGGELTQHWKGFVYIINHEKSLIARKMDVHENGRFALRVR